MKEHRIFPFSRNATVHDGQSTGGLYRVQVLDRAVEILELLADSDRDVGPAEIANRLGIHKSTIHRLLTVLSRHTLVTKGGDDGKYRLGLRLFDWGHRAVARLDLRRVAQPVLERLTVATGESCHVCVLDKDEMVSVALAESPRTVRTPMTLGRRTPLHCTSVGKALIAYLPDATVHDLLSDRAARAYTKRTLTTRAAILAELAAVRERGFAVDDEEIEDGLRCVGAPVRDYSNNVAAAISVAGPAFRITKERVPDLALTVIGSAHELSLALGYRPLQRQTRRKQARSEEPHL